MNCPNCKRRTTKEKFYCDDPVCKSDRAVKRGLAIWKKIKEKATNK